MTQPRRVQRRGIAVQERILDAAVRALVENGYAGTSTLRIQQMAEVSRGSLLHQFPSRDALLVAAVQHLAAARFNEMGTRTTWPDDPHDRIRAAVLAMWSTYQQDYFWAATELWLAARHNAELRGSLEQQERVLYKQVRAVTDAMFGEPLNQHPDYARVRETLNTSMRGVALTYAFDRRSAMRDPHIADWVALAVRVLLGE
ncbi:TetR/AcrR family transcriptional regulator [Mycolicibacterium sp. lyk4-40-TYG-92]|uniref:TetR/AcrR family transcriptional regulator n=1 Tax=Mycolicibacterium sp. lyk4-40-TYG-92 TaxID=3040295 RepID=UPI00254F2044|nr:TetR/AcrR family transcriptional regulator [Mycolicibacterium sp. lyk4-40-TYG-92]